MILNNIQVSIDYTNKLKAELETRCQSIFSENQKDLDKVKTCLEELSAVGKAMLDKILLKTMDRVGQRHGFNALM